MVIEAIEPQHKVVRQHFLFVQLKRSWPAGRIDVLSKQKKLFPAQRIETATDV